MAISLRAHFPATDSVVLLVIWTEAGQPPADLEISVRSGRAEAQPAPWQDAWSTLGSTGARPDGSRFEAVRRRTAVTAVTPGTPYVASLRNGARRVLAEAAFESLPERLPDAGTSANFVVFAGSCYYDGADRDGAVARRYDQLFELGDRYTPAMNLFLGDQVYIDAPHTAFENDDIVGDPGATRRWVTNRYDRSLGKLAPLMSRRANVCITDDHDYWNDFPNQPVRFAWPALADPRNRRRLRSVTRQFATDVQLARPAWRADIGSDLSIFVADTRLNRRRGTSAFMTDHDFTTLVRWINDLSCPGVLVIGQPLFSRPYSLASLAGLEKHPELAATLLAALATGALTSIGAAELVVVGKVLWEGGEELLDWLGIAEDDEEPITLTDRNLPAYTQYALLAMALAGARHDILVLAGDPHFGRVAKVRLNRRDGSDPTSIYEVVSSPMALLPGAANTHDAGDLPAKWPPYPFIPPNTSAGAVREVTTLPTYATNRPPFKFWESARGTMAHFTTLGFSRALPDDGVANGVDVEVTFWATAPGPADVRMIRQVKLGLDTGRVGDPADGPRRRLVTHVLTLPPKRDVVAALGNPGEPWSPRFLHQVLHDIDNDLAEYYTSADFRDSDRVRIYHVGGRAHLRTGADDDPSNNLDNLPQLRAGDLLP